MRTEVKDKRKAGVLVCLVCYNKNTVGWMAYNEQKSISHPLGNWKVSDQGASRFGGWLGPASWFLAIFTLCPHMAEGARELY